MPESPPIFSFEAEQAKAAAMKKIHTLQQKALVDNWYSVFTDDTDPLTPEKVQRKYNELTHPAPDGTGAKPKYSHIGGKLLATADTIEEYGNNFAASVDEGTSVGVSMFGGNSWLGKLLNQLWTAIRALFDWMGGNAGSFTEAYANITTQDINQSFDGKMQAMGKVPEHAAFMQQTGLVEQGKAAIAQKVNVEAGLPGAAVEPDFNLEDYVAASAPKPPVKKKPIVEKGASPEDAVAGAITTAIENTKQQLPMLADLEPDEAKKLKEFEATLIENGKELVRSGNLPEDSAEFSERIIRKTAADRGVSLGANADKTSFNEIITTLKADSKQADYGVLLDVLHGELKEAHTAVKDTIGVKTEPASAKGKAEVPAETKTEDPAVGTNKNAPGEEPKPAVDKQAAQMAAEAAEAKRAAAEHAKELKKLQSRAKDMETLITTKTTAAVKNGIRDTVADGVTDSYNATRMGLGYGDVANDIITINTFRKTHHAGKDEKSLEIQKENLYRFAYTNGYALTPNQVNTIAEIAEGTVRTIVKNPENQNISRNQIAQKIQQAVYKTLADNKNVINGKGTYKIDDYEKGGKKADMLAEIAGEIYAAINE
ncbi:MAG: hypothetical protein KGJ21_07380, partial [Pseudomonadota bacterium]|nr:hypothetical protein [Pseudomonadota bacterium]